MDLEFDSDGPSVKIRPARARDGQDRRGEGILFKIVVFLSCVGGLLALLIPAVQSAGRPPDDPNVPVITARSCWPYTITNQTTAAFLRLMLPMRMELRCIAGEC